MFGYDGENDESAIAKLIGPSPVWLRPGSELRIRECTKLNGMEHEIELTIYNAPGATLPADLLQVRR